ncbi:MAG TPA: O-antigen ligase family protein [Mycobacteriales bacterium]|nr:O-antigen ligase family protein [Mycobacteriales bacterium]
MTDGRAAAGAGPARDPFDTATVLLAVTAVALLGFRQQFKVPYTGLGLSPAQLLVLAAGVLWVVTRLVGQPGRLGVRALRIAIGFVVLSALLSYAVAMLAVLPTEKYADSQQALVSVLTLSAFSMFVLEALRSRQQIELVLRCLLIAGALSALFALVQSTVHLDLAASFRPPGLKGTATLAESFRAGLVRARGTAQHPLEFGAVTSALIPLGLGVTFAARRRGRAAWPWGAITLVIAAGAVVSLSRSAVIGVACAVAVMASRWSVRRLMGLLAGVGALVAAAVLGGSKTASALGSLFTSGSHDYSLESRAAGRSYAFRVLFDHLWLGQGLGTYDIPRQPILDNQYLDQVIESGIVGLLAMVAVLVVAVRYAVRSVSRQRDPVAAELASGVAGAIVTIITTDAVLDSAAFVQISTIGALLVGLSGALWCLSQDGGATAAGRTTVGVTAEPG